MFLILCIVVVMLLHCLLMAAAAWWFGVRVLSVSIGFGPKLFSWGVFSLSLFPFCGSVRMLDSRLDKVETEQMKEAYDHKSRWVRMSIPLISFAVLLGIAYVLLGANVSDIFFASFSQIVMGALSPLTEGVRLIGEIDILINSSSLAVILALTIIKMSAFNLLPLPSLNGWQILADLLGIPDKVNEIFFKVGILVSLAMVISWLTAFVVYLMQ